MSETLLHKSKALDADKIAALPFLHNDLLLGFM